MPTGSAHVDPTQLQDLVPGVPTSAIAELAASSRTVTFARGKTIVGGDVATGPGVVVDGTVRLILRSADGREALLRTVGRGAMFGLITLFEAERGVISAERSIVAVTTATVILFDRLALLRLAGRHAPLAMHIARNLADSASLVGDTAGQLAFLTVRQRLAAHLLTIAEHGPAGRGVAVVTQQEMANAIGSVREVVHRTLHELREDGLVRLSPGRVEILDRKELTDTAFGVT